MNLPRVIINDNYADFLNGMEVEATVISTDETISQGTRVMGFHNSIAASTGLTVPRERQSHYIGVEGTITSVMDAADRHDRRHVKIKKV